MTLDLSTMRTARFPRPAAVAPSRRSRLLVTAAVVLLAATMVAAFLHTAQQEFLATELLNKVFVVLVVVVGAALALRAVPLPRPGVVEVAILAYLGWVLLSIVVPHDYEAVDPTTGLDLLLYQSVLRGVLLPFGVYLAARVVLVDERRVRWLLWTVVGMTAYSAWVSIMQFHGPRALVWPRYIVDRPSWPGRAVGVFDQPVTNGLILVIGLLVCLLLAERGAFSWPVRIALYGVAAASTYAVYLTHTRAAVLGLVVVVVMGMLFARGWRRGFVGAGVLGALALASKGVSTLFSPDRKAGGFGSPNEVYDRLNLVSTALDAILHHPVLGIGLGRFAMYNTYQHVVWSTGVDFSRGQTQVAHETELGIAAEIGLPGLVCWVVTLVGIGTLLWRAARRLPADQLGGAPLALVAGVGLVVMVTNGTTVDLRLLEFATMAPLVLAGGAVAALDRHRAAHPDTSPPAAVLARVDAAVVAPPRVELVARWTAGVGAVVLAVAYLVGVQTALGRQVDLALVRAVAAPNEPVRIAVRAVLTSVTVPAAAVLTALLVLIHLRAGRRRAALYTAAVVVGAEILTEVVKIALPGAGEENTLPSGHMTFLAAVAVVLVTAMPRPRRWPVGGVSVVLLAVAAVATWAIGWHRPSDVIAAAGAVGIAWGVAVMVILPRLSAVEPAVEPAAPPPAPTAAPAEVVAAQVVPDEQVPEAQPVLVTEPLATGRPLDFAGPITAVRSNGAASNGAASNGTHGDEDLSEAAATGSTSARAARTRRVAGMRRPPAPPRAADG